MVPRPVLANSFFGVYVTTQNSNCYNIDITLSLNSRELLRAKMGSLLVIDTMPYMSQPYEMSPDSARPIILVTPV